ncbi:hypothetical protein CVT25_010105 [Psilocybe cyanescens]|uniref:Uncharacterized protein n=1 Tax=Psilocybe cyanescens TaxID=93625 RepID=A0A409WCE0_PSICY|nr:hypothetical protein CVT25_010105 [Psilocybe cyanescens]
MVKELEVKFQLTEVERKALEEKFHLVEVERKTLEKKFQLAEVELKKALGQETKRKTLAEKASMETNAIQAENLEDNDAFLEVDATRTLLHDDKI